ncbi:MAG: hypothetical protein WCX31_14445 [Salinivirgaceae bacterium]|jgi:hypothetical protein
MKAILLLTVLALCVVANGQKIIQEINSSDTLTNYIVRLNDETTLSGKILEKNTIEIIFYDITIGKVTIPLKSIAAITPLSSNQYCILTTNDGKVFTGMIISLNEIEVTFKTETLGDLTISKSKIRDIKIVEKEQIVNGKYFFPNPHPTRYFFGPSAIPLKKGEGYFQNAWILANSAQVGLSDNFSIGGGMVIPVLFFVTPKVGFKVAEKVHIGGGILFASTFSTVESFGMGVGYGSITLGSNENNFTLSAGWGMSKQENYNEQTFTSTYSWEFAKRPIITFSGMVRIAPKMALVTENWVVSIPETDYNTNETTYPYYTIISAGFRFMKEKNSFDFGLALPIIDGETVGIPYVDYVFKF